MNSIANVFSIRDRYRSKRKSSSELLLPSALTVSKYVCYNSGSTYIFVLIMSLGLLLFLAIAVHTTVFEAQVSQASKNYSNLSLLAHSGVERAVLVINSQLETERAGIAKAVFEQLQPDDDYSQIFINEAASIIRRKFAGTSLVYNLTLDGSPMDIYTVTVRIDPLAGTSGFALASVARKEGLPTAEEVTAEIVCEGTAVVHGHTDDYIVVENDIIWRIQKITQKR